MPHHPADDSSTEADRIQLVVFYAKPDDEPRKQPSPEVVAIYRNESCVACSILRSEGNPQLTDMVTTARVLAFDKAGGELSMRNVVVEENWSLYAIRRYAEHSDQYLPETDPFRPTARTSVSEMSY